MVKKEMKKKTQDQHEKKNSFKQTTTKFMSHVR